MSKPCFVYIIGHEHATFGHAVKVGLSDGIRNRLSQLQTGSCEELTLFFSARLPNRQVAEQVEKLFHDTFTDHCIRGEWFSMSPARAMFMLGNILAEVARHLYPPSMIEEAQAEIGVPLAFRPFHNADYDTQADWVNDWCQREEAAYEDAAP